MQHVTYETSIYGFKHGIMLLRTSFYLLDNVRYPHIHLVIHSFAYVSIIGLCCAIIITDNLPICQILWYLLLRDALIWLICLYCSRPIDHLCSTIVQILCYTIMKDSHIIQPTHCTMYSMP